VGSTYRLSNVTGSALNIVRNANVDLLNETTRTLSWLLLSTEYEAQSWSRYKEYMQQCFDYEDLKKSVNYAATSNKGDNFFKLFCHFRQPSNTMFSGNDPTERLINMVNNNK